MPKIDAAIRGAANRGQVRRDNKWCDIIVGTTQLSGLPIKVGGRVDGYNGDDGTLLEVKNRMKRLFDRIVTYEKVQLHVSSASCRPTLLLYP